MNNWRLSTDATIFVSTEGERGIYIASSEKNAYKNAVIKDVKWRDYKTLFISDCKFSSLRFAIEEGRQPIPVRIEVKSNALPYPEDWYTLENFDMGTLGDIISQLSIISGEINEEFELIFNINNPSVCSLITEKMSQFKGCAEELSRRLAVDLGSKTRKWKPGHKYESEDKTIIYLGTFSSRKENSIKSNFLNDASVVEAKLYVTSLLPNEKTITDVLNGRSFSSTDEDGIKILYKSPSSVDSGEVLKDDFAGNIEDYWEGLIDRTSEKFKTTTIFGREIYSNIKDILDIFSLQSKHTYDYLNVKAIDKLEGILKVWGWETLIKNWNNNYYVWKLGEDLSIKDNIKNLCSHINFEIRDENLQSIQYYGELFKRIGVNLDEICKKLITDWTKVYNKLDNLSYSEFIDHYEYFANKPYLFAISVSQRVISLRYYYSVKKDDASLKTILGPGCDELEEIIREIFNYSVNNYGDGIKEYKVFNIGTIRNPKSYVRTEITLKNIIDFANKEMKLTDALKNEIVNKKFTNIIIETDDSSELK